MHSADRIVPELQHLEVGEVLPMQGEGTGMRVEILEPNRVFALRSEDGRWVWTFALSEVEARRGSSAATGSTRPGRRLD